jgi:hypothetical protein
MRTLDHLNRWRVPLRGYIAGDQHNGAFQLRIRPTTARVYVIASNGGGWDHVSVSVSNERRLPTWGEMAYIKRLFFDDGEAVMQLHPPAAQYVNNAEVLHLWRPHDDVVPLPPLWMVGLPGVTPADMPRVMAALR